MLKSSVAAVLAPIVIVSLLAWAGGSAPAGAAGISPAEAAATAGRTALGATLAPRPRPRRRKRAPQAS